MKLHCPHCGVRGAAADSYRGKTVQCPRCREKFIAHEEMATGAIETAEPAVAGEQLTPGERQEDLLGKEQPTKPENAANPPAAGERLAADATAGEAAETSEQRLVPPAAEARHEEEREAVPDWDKIAAEIEAQTASGDLRQAGEKEELPDGLFAETAGERQAWPEEEETVEQPLAEPPKAENVGTGDRLSDREESVDAVAGPGAGEEQCWQCGRKNLSGASFAASGGRLYCPECAPSAEPLPDIAGSPGGPPPLFDTEDVEPAHDSEGQLPRFTLGGTLREAWKKTDGAKGPILAASAVMYVTLLVMAAAAGFLLPMFGHDLAGESTLAGMIVNGLFRGLIDAISVLFGAGLIYMGIRKVAGEVISWRMIFAGFADSGKIIVATLLQSVLIVIGLLVLVLPGIYLAIGYSMTIPLIVDRKMSPWQAMETSRKAVHRVWWRVFGLYLAMGLLLLVSMVPLGIGLIWTWPMFVILAGVVYRYLFAAEK